MKITERERLIIEKAFQDDVAWIKDEKQHNAWMVERWRVFMRANDAIEKSRKENRSDRLVRNLLSVPKWARQPRA